MTFFKNLYKDYQESKYSTYEGFLEWFLKRKLNFLGKIIFAYLLWTIWIVFFLHPHWFIFFFYGVIVLSIMVIFLEWWNERKKRR
ncbi:TPA: hypothetical protein ACHVGK_001107 [Streptococcus suis]